MHKKWILITLVFMTVQVVFAQSDGSQTTLYTAKQQQLRITAGNVRLVRDEKNGGYHLYVKNVKHI